MRHPEQSFDEIYLGNEDQQSFETCNWKTKRLGEIPHDANGKPLTGKLADILKPAFVRRSEIEAALLNAREDEAREVYRNMLENGQFIMGG